MTCRNLAVHKRLLRGHATVDEAPPFAKSPSSLRPLPRGDTLRHGEPERPEQGRMILTRRLLCSIIAATLQSRRLLAKELSWPEARDLWYTWSDTLVALTIGAAILKIPMKYVVAVTAFKNYCSGDRIYCGTDYCPHLAITLPDFGPLFPDGKNDRSGMGASRYPNIINVAIVPADPPALTGFESAHDFTTFETDTYGLEYELDDGRLVRGYANNGRLIDMSFRPDFHFYRMTTYLDRKLAITTDVNLSHLDKWKSIDAAILSLITKWAGNS